MTNQRKLLLFVVIQLVNLSFYAVANAQKLAIFNADQKRIAVIKQGKGLDFRLNYNLVFPEGNDSIVEARLYGEIDTIIGDRITFVENEVILKFTKTSTYLVEEVYEYTDLKVSLGDIKGISHTPALQSVGNAFLTLGIVALLASPLLGVSPSGGKYVTERFALVAGIGGFSTVVGATLYFSFRQRPFQFKKFDGPDYFKRYQAGSLSVIE